jgi:hypothetical protein
VPSLQQYTRCFLLAVIAFSAFAQKSANFVPSGFKWAPGTFTELDFTHTISSAKDLPAPERASLIAAIATQLRLFKTDSEITSEHELRHVALQSRFKFVDLNEDGIPEVIVQPVGLKAGCGGTGNCPFWVFLKTAHGYKVILDTRDKDGIGGIELHRIEPALHGGFHDISVASHDSASARTVLIYGFRQNYYHLIRCYSLSWLSQPGMKYRKTPSITPCEATH